MATKGLEISRYSDEELAIFDALLDEKIAKTNQEIELYHSQLKDLADNEDMKFNSLTDATSTADVERLHNMLGRQKKHLVHLQNAKLRIQNKVYGVCRETGKLISKERLMAVPHATLSIDAKQKK